MISDIRFLLQSCDAAVVEYEDGDHRIINIYRLLVKQLRGLDYCLYSDGNTLMLFCVKWSSSARSCQVTPAQSNLLFCLLAGSRDAAGVNHVQQELRLRLWHRSALLPPGWRGGGVLPAHTQPPPPRPRRGHLEEVRAAADASPVAQPEALAVRRPAVRRRTPGGGVWPAGRWLQPLCGTPPVLHHPGLHVEQQLRRRHQAGAGGVREAGVAPGPPRLLANQQHEQQHRRSSWSAGDQLSGELRVPAGPPHCSDGLHRPVRGVSIQHAEREERRWSADGGDVRAVSGLTATQQQWQWIRWAFILKGYVVIMFQVFFS